MGLDIRLPIGLMFAIIGLILTIYGLFTTGDEQLYARSLAVNINLWWGIIMIAFGLLMLFLGRRGASSFRTAEESVEGELTEEREHKTGLEH